MKSSTILSKPPYHLLAMIIFILVSIFFNMPAFQGNKLASHDYFTWSFGAQETIDYYKTTGENAQWTNAQFGGMPSVMINYYAETNWFQKVWYGLTGYKTGMPFNPAYFFFWAMFTFYLLSTALKIKPLIGVLGSIAFAFSTYHPIIIAAGHNTKMVDLAFLPGIIAGIIWAYKGRYLMGAAVAGLFLSFFLDAGHYQIIFYGAIFCALIAIGYLFEAIKKKELKTWGIASALLVVAVGVSFLSSSSRILQTLTYTELSMRGGNSVLSENTSTGLEKDYAFAWSNGIGEAFCMVVPNLYGASSSYELNQSSNYAQALTQAGVSPQDAANMSKNAPTYWGVQSSLSGPMYFGAIIFFLGILGLVSIRSSVKWWILGAGIICLFFSFGKNMAWLNFFLFDHVPMFNKFRSPNMAMSLTGLAFPILAVWGLHAFISESIPNLQAKKHLKLSAIITGAIILLILVNIVLIYSFIGLGDEGLKGQLTQYFGPQGAENILQALIKDRSSMAYSSWFKSFLFIGVTVGILYAIIKNKLKVVPGLVVLIVIVSIDMMSIGKKYLNETHYMDDFTFENQFRASEIDKEILKDQDLYYRVFDTRQSPFNDAKASIFHKSIGGYHPAKMQAYQDLITAHIGSFNGAVLSMLNTKYIISRGQQQQQDIYQINPGALGNAWFVSRSKVVNSRKEALDALAASQLGAPPNPTDFNPAEEVIMEKEVAQNVNAKSWIVDSEQRPSIELTSYTPNQLVFKSNNTEDGFAVFSDVYYPKGWVARIGNSEATIQEVNFLLRGLEIPKGEHTITFSFENPAFEKGERFGLFGSIGLTLLILAALGQFVLDLKKKKSTNV